MKPERNRPYDQPADHVFIIHTLVYSQDEHDCGDRQQLQIALAAPHGMNVPWYEWEGNVQHLIEDHGIPEVARNGEPSPPVHSTFPVVEPPQETGGEDTEYDLETVTTLRFEEVRHRGGAGIIIHGTASMRAKGGETQLAGVSVHMGMSDTPRNRASAVRMTPATADPLA